MQINHGKSNLKQDLGGWALGLAVVCLTFAIAVPAHADFTWAGADASQITGFDTGGTTNQGGGSTGDMVVGVDDLAGVLGDGEQILGGVQPLESTTAIIGDGLDAIGAVTLNDSISRWIITDTGTESLIIGNEGQGLLELGTSATVDVAGTTVLGAEAFGYGILDVNGVNFPGGRLKTEDLIVGDAGVGIVEVNNRGSIVSAESFVGATTSTGVGTVTLTDSGTRWSVRGSLEIGGDIGLTQGPSQGTVQVSNDALLQVSPEVTSEGPPATFSSTPGVFTVNKQGTLQLLGGTVRAFVPLGTGDPPDTVPVYTNITNNGLVSGDGLIDAEMTIGVGGQLSNATAQVQNGSTVTNVRESLTVAGAVTNNGRIESLGGEMIFDSVVTNSGTGIVHARDAILDFRNTPPEDGTIDLQQNGTMVLGGEITVIGDVDHSGGDTFTLEDTTLLIIGDLTFTTGGIFGLTADGEGPPATITGSANLANATIDLELDAGFSPDPGEPFALLTANDGIPFTPSNAVDSANGMIFNFSVVGNTLFAENSGAITMPVGADFNGDGEVNALDLQIWENNYPIASGAIKEMGDADGDGDVDGADFFKIQRDFGITPPPPIVASATVPEPSTLALALLTIACCPRRRVSR